MSYQAIKLLDEVYCTIVDENRESKSISYVLQLIDDLQGKIETLNDK